MGRPKGSRVPCRVCGDHRVEEAPRRWRVGLCDRCLPEWERGRRKERLVTVALEPRLMQELAKRATDADLSRGTYLKLLFMEDLVEPERRQKRGW